MIPAYGNLGPMALYTFCQTKGRGQGTNTWLSNPGENLAITIALKPEDFGNDPVTLNKAVTLAAAKAIEKVAETEAAIKWPNDILIENKKCCGLLMETAKIGKDNYLFAGIGINVNQSKWPANLKAISLKNTAKKELNLDKVMRELMLAICIYTNDIVNEHSLISKEFNENLWMRKMRVILETPEGEMEAEMEEVDEKGKLVFRNSEGKVYSLHHGQVRISKKNPGFL